MQNPSMCILYHQKMKHSIAELWWYTIIWCLRTFLQAQFRIEKPYGCGTSPAETHEALIWKMTLRPCGSDLQPFCWSISLWRDREAIPASPAWSRSPACYYLMASESGDQIVGVSDSVFADLQHDIVHSASWEYLLYQLYRMISIVILVHSTARVFRNLEMKRTCNR